MKSALVASIVVAVLAGASMRAAQATIVRPTVVTPLDMIKPHWGRTGMSYVIAHRGVRIFDKRKLGNFA